MFKKGDKVRCITKSSLSDTKDNQYGVIGVIYTVAKDQEFADTIWLTELNPEHGRIANRFELVNTVKETPVMTTTEFKVGDRVKINGVIQPETITEINVRTTYTLSGPLGGGWFAGSLTKLPDERWQALTWKEKAHITPQLSSKQYTSEQAVKDEWKNSDFFIRAVQIA